MANRTSREQSTHHRKVREIARHLRMEGYTVRADGVRGYARPRPIGRQMKRPDIEATRLGVRRIIEVETPSSLRSDKEQLKTFTRHAAQKRGTKFEVVVTKPRRTQISSRKRR